MSENIAKGSDCTDQKCRICMQAKSYQASLFRRNLSMKVMKLAEVKIFEGDGLPTTICLECESDLEKCYMFRAQVLWADKKFREELLFPKDAVEECNVKQEHIQFNKYLNENYVSDYENIDCHNILDTFQKTEVACADKSAESINIMNTIQKTEIVSDDLVVEPINHVIVDENREKEDEMEVTYDPLGHEEAPSETNIKTDYSSNLYPLGYLKEEAIHILDTESSIAETSVPTTSSSVRRKELQSSFLVKTDKSNPLEMERMRDKQLRNITLGHVAPKTNLAFNNTLRPFQSMGPQTISHANLDTLQNKSMTNAPNENHTHIIPLVSTDPLFVVETQYQSPRERNSTDEPLESISADTNTGVCDNTDKNKQESSCTTCNEDFYTSDLLQEHKDGRSYFCRVCTKEFENHAVLEAHFITHTAFQCKTCSKVFYCKTDILKHKSTSSCGRVLVECGICNKKFGRKSLNTHKVKFHSVTIGSCECVVCEKTFISSEILTDHLKLSHVAYEFVECKMCHRLFLGPERLKNHIKTVHLYNKPVSAACSVCGKVCNGTIALKSHQASHDKTVLQCEICGKPVTGRSAMHNHVRNEHSKKVLINCELCHKQFDSERKWKSHLRLSSKHAGHDPGVCEICGKSYKSKDILKRHMAIHTNEKPFTCDICDAAFNYSSSLYLHKRVHSSVGKFSCNGCGLSFKWKHTLEKHVNKCKDNLRTIKINCSETVFPP